MLINLNFYISLSRYSLIANYKSINYSTSLVDLLQVDCRARGLGFWPDCLNLNLARSNFVADTGDRMYRSEKMLNEMFISYNVTYVTKRVHTLVSHVMPHPTREPSANTTRGARRPRAIAPLYCANVKQHRNLEITPRLPSDIIT